jgi:hypothetical protein
MLRDNPGRMREILFELSLQAGDTLPEVDTNSFDEFFVTPTSEDNEIAIGMDAEAAGPSQILGDDSNRARYSSSLEH